ncbi:Acyltransferase [Popillia japonica]|uniref:Acyltransferase n=1 Tax=Popillia japonica TaxID=7064 RepID=A0AAW1MHE8_POPJA
MHEYIVQVKDSVYEVLVNYIDIDFTLWLSWLLMPLIITFILPLVIVILLYISALILYTYKLHWNHVRTVFDRGDKWGAARKAVAAVWDSHGWIWHGYEVTGLENINNKDPALIVYYHGAIPIDVYYFLTKVLLFKNRLVHTVADYFLFNIPGFAIIAESMKVIPGTIQSCANVLKEGNLLAIAPGGVYESQFSHNYNLMWKKRLGFAKVALEAKVKMFVKHLGPPIYGGFPVKMITHIGKPISYDPSLTPEKLQEKVAEAINQLIFEHQRLPGSITYGLLDRIPYLRNKRLRKSK